MIEGGLMHKVYRNVHCDIAAANSNDPAGGCFGKGSRLKCCLLDSKPMKCL
jgi:hypothetical protein